MTSALGAAIREFPCHRWVRFDVLALSDLATWLPFNNVTVFPGPTVHLFFANACRVDRA
ncbi:hypothetical protein [Mycobacterium mantenii]|uniref:hypothetical protein n=1 Tax=Mycobacterium mantenii TaxID=560555 RepID=UPI001301A98A|nr:hypothetical protein [Mycobacterium mantenii]